MLEQQNGLIESKTISVAAYDGLMAAPVKLTVPSARTVAEDLSLHSRVQQAPQSTLQIATAQFKALQQRHQRHPLLAGTSGLTVSGNDSASISITAGSIANINAALNGLIYRPTKNYAGGDTLTSQPTTDQRQIQTPSGSPSRPTPQHLY